MKLLGCTQSSNHPSKTAADKEMKPKHIHVATFGTVVQSVVGLVTSFRMVVFVCIFAFCLPTSSSLKALRRDPHIHVEEPGESMPVSPQPPFTTLARRACEF